METFEIAPATSDDDRAVRVLLPDFVKRRIPPVRFVARDDASRVIGAAALFPCPLGNPVGFKMMLRVARPFRGRGIGRALVAEASAESKRRRVAALYAHKAVSPFGDELSAWVALGFDQRKTENVYESEPSRLLEIVDPLYEKMVRLKWIPENAEIVPLRDAPHEDVARMHVRLLGGSMNHILPRIMGFADVSYDPVLSRVLLLDGEVQGFVLARLPEPDCSSVEALVVDPSLRLGWAHVLLKRETALHSVASKRKGIRFTAYDQHRDTRKMASETGARLVASNVLPYMMLDAGNLSN
ncbi:MAG: hypothetical protein CMJ18_11665 [Phycisphaeraceae bacterium]|nr:hypothetical protein [Phycisphaeraceae bacterium]